MTITDMTGTFLNWLDSYILMVPSWLRIAVVILFVAFVIARRLRKLYKTPRP